MGSGMASSSASGSPGKRPPGPHPIHICDRHMHHGHRDIQIWLRIGQWIMAKVAADKQDSRATPTVRPFTHSLVRPPSSILSVPSVPARSVHAYFPLNLPPRLPATPSLFTSPSRLFQLPRFFSPALPALPGRVALTVLSGPGKRPFLFEPALHT